MGNALKEKEEQRRAEAEKEKLRRTTMQSICFNEIRTFQNMNQCQKTKTQQDIRWLIRTGRRPIEMNKSRMRLNNQGVR